MENLRPMILAASLFSLSLKTLVIILYGAMVGATAVTIISDKRDPVKAFAWIVVIVLIPVMGFILYMAFGQNLRKQKIFNRKSMEDYLQLKKRISQQLYEINSPMLCTIEEIVSNRDIITLLLNNSKSLLTVRNEVTVLNNGSETFPAIIDALRKARSYIHMEYYIIQNDTLGREIAGILAEKARQGVEVRVIYDDVGSWGLGRKFIRPLREAGVRIHCFMPVVFPWFTSKINYRNHRKIVVVDGTVAFTGGLNIAERYLSGIKRVGKWRDVHLKIRGEAVMSLQTIFAMDWNFVSGEQLEGRDKYFTGTAVRKNTPVQIAASGPDSDWASIMQCYFSAITKARDHIYISSPYFLPNEAILTALKVAALSGVDVRLMIPHKSDSKMVYWATRSYITEMLRANVKVYLYGGFNHSKLLMVDSRFGSVGTANMDIRSFEDNFEVTAMIYDREKTLELERDFLHDLKHSRRLTLEKWERRPRREGFYEAVSRLFSPLL